MAVADDLSVDLPTGFVAACEIRLEPRVIALMALVGHTHADLCISASVLEPCIVAEYMPEMQKDIKVKKSKGGAGVPK